MKHDDTDFTRAWNSLTTSGEMSGEPPRPFTPVGLRKDVQEEGPLYHGTRADLRPGDLLTPGHASNYGSRQTANFVYLTARKEGAALAAELAAGEGLAWVYVVEPLGPIEDDPNVTDRKFPGNPTRSYRTRQPLRVVREERDWEPLAPQVLEKSGSGCARPRAWGSRPSTNRPLDTPFQTCYLYKAVRAARRSRGMP